MAANAVVLLWGCCEVVRYALVLFLDGSRDYTRALWEVKTSESLDK
jgi:hypothetical protein